MANQMHDIEAIIEDKIQRISELISQSEYGYGEAMRELIELRCRWGDGVYAAALQTVGQEILERRGENVLKQTQKFMDAAYGILTMDEGLAPMIWKALENSSKCLRMANALVQAVAQWAVHPDDPRAKEAVVSILKGIIEMPYDALSSRSGGASPDQYYARHQILPQGFRLQVANPEGEVVAILEVQCNTDDALGRLVHQMASRIVRRLEHSGVNIQLA